jgi:peptidoglycan/xylan/chitin deacetylase (PgdA/CDA1 family)
MYHDVVDSGAYDGSGFLGADANLYKVARNQFKAQLSAIAGAGIVPASILDFLPSPTDSSPLIITFDDGGVSAHSVVAEYFDDLSWPAHFFITAGCVDKAGFLNANQIRDLHRRGHVIGSHSYSHQALSNCPPEVIRDEWRKSIDLLAPIIGTKIRVASVPGGYYSREVARLAAEAGIEALFTSEPTTKTEVVEGCLVLGRYAIQRWMSPTTIVGLANGSGFARSRQVFLWNTKKVLKTLGGNQYLKLRKRLTNRSVSEHA